MITLPSFNHWPSLLVIPMICLFPASASTEFTAQDAYRHLRSMVTEQGAVLEVAEVVDTVNEVLLSEVRVGTREFPGNWQGTIEWVRLSQQNDGTVRINIPKIMTIENSLLGIHQSFGTLLVTGFLGEISKMDGGIRIVLSGERLQQFSGISADYDNGTQTANNRQLQTQLHQWQAEIIPGQVEQSIDANLAAQMLNVAVLDDDSSDIFRGSFKEFRASHQGPLGHFLDLASSPFGMDWFRTSVRFTSGEARYWASQHEDKTYIVRSGAFALDFNSRPNQISKTSKGSKLHIQTIVEGRIEDAFQIDSLELQNQITVLEDVQNTIIAVNANLSGVEINRHLIPPNNANQKAAKGLFFPGSLILEGSVTIPSNRADELFVGKKPEFGDDEFAEWKLADLQVDFLGTTLTAQGGARQVFLENPKEKWRLIGQMVAYIDGLKGALETIKPLGTLSQTGETVLWMVTMAGQKESKDRLRYNITFNNDGSLTVNSFTIK